MKSLLLKLLASIFVLTLIAAACGDDDDADPAAQEPAEEPADEPAEEPADEPAVEPADEPAEEPAEEAGGDGGWDAIVAAAEAEGKVVMYSVMVPDVNERLVAAFSEAFPNIEMELIRVPGNEVDALLDAEETTGADGADVVANVNAAWVFEASGAGRLADFVGPDATGPDWAGTEYLVDNRIQYSTFANLGLAWNTDAFPDGGPTQFVDLLDPAYAGGQIGLPEPVVGIVADFYATLQDLEGEDFLAALAAQEPVFFPSAVPLEQALAAGEITVGGYATQQGITVAAADGAPVEFASPQGAWVPPIMSYIPAWAQNPNAAQVVINFMASPDGQAVLAEGSFSPVPGVPTAFGPIEGVTVSNVERFIEPGWYEEYFATFNEIFGR